jgi:hypothetical protein
VYILIYILALWEIKTSTIQFIWLDLDSGKVPGSVQYKNPEKIANIQKKGHRNPEIFVKINTFRQ